jgi:hypothetical protein
MNTKFKLFFISLIISFQSIFAQYDILFEFLPNMNQAAYGIGHTNDGQNLYAVCGGSDTEPYYSCQIEKFDIAHNSWTVLSDTSYYRCYCNAEYLQTYGFTSGLPTTYKRIYILNGIVLKENNLVEYSHVVESIDIGTGNSSYCVSNPFPVEYAGSAVWDYKIYTFGGNNFEGYSNRLYAFDPTTETWERLPDMPEAKQTSGAIVDGVLYVFGGYNGTTSKRIDAYNIENKSWLYKGDMPVGISAHTTVASGKYIWIIGDYSNLTSLAVYNTENNEFTQLSSNMTGRRHAGAQIIDNYLYVFGGNQASSGAVLNSLEQADISNYIVSTDDDDIQLNPDFKLYQNYPNPFNPTTEITFNLPEPGVVKLKVFDLLGREVAVLESGYFPAGNYKTTWDATGIANGVYIYRLQAGKYHESKKMLLLR